MQDRSGNDEDDKVGEHPDADLTKPAVHHISQGGPKLTLTAVSGVLVGTGDVVWIMIWLDGAGRARVVLLDAFCSLVGFILDKWLFAVFLTSLIFLVLLILALIFLAA